MTSALPATLSVPRDAQVAQDKTAEAATFQDVRLANATVLDNAVEATIIPKALVANAKVLDKAVKAAKAHIKLNEAVEARKVKHTAAKTAEAPSRTLAWPTPTY